MILMGVLMFTGKMNDITGYLSTTQESGSKEEKEEESAGDDSGAQNAGAESQGSSEDQESAEQDSGDQSKTAAYDFELTDQYGESHRLSDYKGKVIFLNFWGPGARRAGRRCRISRNCMKNMRPRARTPRL